MTWDPGRALVALKAEQDALGADANEMLLTEQRLLRGAPLAADVLLHLMQYSTNERVRMDAAKSVLERVLGKPGEGVGGGAPMDPIQKLLQQCMIDSATKGTAISVTSTDATPVHGLHEFEPGSNE